MNKPNLESAYYASQLVVAVAVVLSLIALTMQISQNTEALQQDTLTTAKTQSQQELLVLTTGDFAKVWAKSITAPESLAPAELIQVDAYIWGIFDGRQAEFLQYQRGAMDEATWQTRITGITANLTTEWQKNWWKLNKNVFSANFTQYVDEIVAKQPALPWGNYLQELHSLHLPTEGATP